MESLLLVREMIINFFKRFEPVITVLLRFALGFYIFTLIRELGYIRPEIAEYYNLVPVPLILLLAIAFVILPLSLSYLIMIVDVALRFSSSIEVAAIIFVFLLCMLLFYARMAAKESILILLTIVAFRFGFIYLIPFIAGMYFSVMAVIPVAIAIFLISFTPHIYDIMAITQTADLNIAEMPTAFGYVYEAFLTALQYNSAWSFQAFIFAMAIIVISIVSRMSFNFAKEIAIGLGFILIVVGYVMAFSIDIMDVNLGTTIMMTLFSALIALFIRLFDPILDYRRAESVQFEDNGNYYFVRVIPKVKLEYNRRKRQASPPIDDDVEDDFYDEED